MSKVLTIGMPVYNDIDFIEESIKSVLNQSFKDFELVISDDCSTDGCSEICLKYAEIDSRIKYIRQDKNIGISRNMKALLSMSTAKYFMWAGDDDLMDVDFVKSLFELLEQNPEAVSAFSSMALIDENSKVASEVIDYDYSNPNKFLRLKFFIKNDTDYFGYGMFVREKIEEVEFPIWWWPNTKTPYNNIFPTLCFYLAKGDFAYIKTKALFFKRIKTESQTNHLLVGKNNAIKESFAYWIRKFNLVCFSLSLISKADSIILALIISPLIYYNWFLKPSVKQFNLALSAFMRNKLKV